jgi:hypothetical protein
MLIFGNTLTDAQTQAIEALRLSETPFLDLTLDMPRFSGCDAFVTGSPDWTDDPYYTRTWTIRPNGTVIDD